MKIVTVQEAEGQLAKLISEANEGEIIVLKDRDKEAKLYSAAAINPEQDSLELEVELLKAANGPFRPYSRDELEAIAQRVLQEKQRR